MSIDSVGGGSADAAYQARRRALEEERARELSRIEQRNKVEITKAQEAREKALTEVYEDQSLDVEERRQEADRNIERAKAAADARVRSFNDEASKMTEEAKRQFQTKADLLTRNARELDEQRQFMSKQHTDAMKKIKQQHEQARTQDNARLEREANQAYLAAKNEISETQLRGAAELSNVRQNLMDQKLREIAEAEHRLTSLKAERDQAAGSIQSQIDFSKRTGAQQLQRSREQLAHTETMEKMEFEDRLADLNRKNMAEVNRSHIQGRRNLAETTSLYASQIENLRKENQKKASDLQTHSMVTLNSIENEAKMQEQIARQNFNFRHQQSEAQRQLTLKEHREKNEALHAKLAKDYSDQSKLLTAGRAQLLKAQYTQLQNELMAARDVGIKQVNQTEMKNMADVAQHDIHGKDPFYNIQHLGAQLTDSGTEYIVSLAVPEHEQDSIRLTMQRDSLTLSGTRRYEQKIQLEDGHKASTNSYQSYSESFPVRGKLEMGRMSRSYDNGQLTFRIPKS